MLARFVRALSNLNELKNSSNAHLPHSPFDARALSLTMMMIIFVKLFVFTVLFLSVHMYAFK